MDRAYFNWSSGKDSALALYHAVRSGEFSVEALFSVVKAGSGRVSMHETGVGLLERQAEAVGIPLVLLSFDPEGPAEDYRAAMAEQAGRFRAQGLTTALFGDLYLEELRKSREEKCGKMGIKAAFPLWHMPQKEMMAQFIGLGFRAVVTCVDGRVLTEDFLGRVIDEDFLRGLPAGADPRGENGEYHSFVFDGPIFSHPVGFQAKKRYYRDYPDGNGGSHRYWYLELE